MKTRRIGEFSEIVSKGTTPTSVGLSFSNAGIPFLRGEDVLGTFINFNSVKMFIDDHTHAALSRSSLKFGDVLVTIAGTIGRIGFIDEMERQANCNQAVAFIRMPPNCIDPLWLCLLLSSPIYQAKIAAFVVGGAIPNISLEQIRSIEIPDLPISEQRRIAARFKAQLDEVKKVHMALTVQSYETDKLADAIVFDSIRRSWAKSYFLGDAVDEIKRGIGDGWTSFPVWGATRDGLAPAKELPGKKPERYKPAFPGTVFYNPMRILIGSIAFVDEDDKPGITSPDYVALTGKEGVVDSRWFYFWLRSPLGKQCITSLARGAVRERMLFNRLAEGKIDLPDYKLQQTASKVLAELKHLRKAIEMKMNEINILPAKILASSFEM